MSEQALTPSPVASITPADRLNELFDLLRRIVDGIEGLRGDMARVAEAHTAPKPDDERDATAASTLLDATALAELLGCNRRTLRRWELTNEIPKAVHIGGAKRWRRGDIDEWLRKKRK